MWMKKEIWNRCRPKALYGIGFRQVVRGDAEPRRHPMDQRSVRPAGELRRERKKDLDSLLHDRLLEIPSFKLLKRSTYAERPFFFYCITGPSMDVCGSTSGRGNRSAYNWAGFNSPSSSSSSFLFFVFYWLVSNNFRPEEDRCDSHTFFSSWMRGPKKRERKIPMGILPNVRDLRADAFGVGVNPSTPLRCWWPAAVSWPQHGKTSGHADAKQGRKRWQHYSECPMLDALRLLGDFRAQKEGEEESTTHHREWFGNRDTRMSDTPLLTLDVLPRWSCLIAMRIVFGRERTLIEYGSRRLREECRGNVTAV